MRPSTRFAFAALLLALIVVLPTISFSQIPSQFKTVQPGYVKMPNVNINSVQIPSSSIRLVLPKGATSTRGLFVNDANSTGVRGASNRVGLNSSVPNLVGLDTVPTFNGAFASPFPSIDPFQTSDGFFFVSPFVMIGNQPQVGGTTTIPANLVTVSLQLLNPDGTIFANVPFAPFEDLTEDSPNFLPAQYSTGRTQFGDAVQRAEFFNVMGPDWHTLLAPSIKDRVVIQVPALVEVQFGDGTIITVPGYIPSKSSDGNTVVFMLDLLFSALDFNQIVNDINDNSFSTSAMNYHVYPNTFLFSVVDEQGDLSCCTLGFHEYIFETIFPSPRWIYSFASWISPGTFGGGFGDVTALSHETSEALNDPFGNNIVPTWQFPNEPGFCQANLETGDPVENLLNATVPVVTHEGTETFTYHPQTEALLQWFEIGNPSTAIGGAFSYPNTAALTTTATPCPF